MTEPYRTKILQKAIDTVNGSRVQDYGEAESSMGAMSLLWNSYLKAKFNIDIDLTAKDVATMMILFKIGRTISGHNKEDNWIDICGYAANAGEIEYNEQSV